MSVCRVPHWRLPVQERTGRLRCHPFLGGWLPGARGTPRKFFGKCVKTSLRIRSACLPHVGHDDSCSPIDPAIGKQISIWKANEIF